MRSINLKVANRPADLPGDFAIWIFICAELLVFAVFFLAYAFARSGDVEAFNHFQQTLDKESGALNTFVLITSSYFVVRAVQAIKQDLQKQCANWLLAALAGGGIFLIVKIMEFSEKISQGISLSTNTFYMFYLSLTFFHFMHVILGMVILVAVWIGVRKGKYNASEYTGIETGGAYWHMVDLVWIVLFPLIYILN